MSEPTKQQIGDGQDNFGQAAGQMAKAAKQASQEAAKKGAEATANAAAATVKAGVEGGKGRFWRLRSALRLEVPGVRSCPPHGPCDIRCSKS